MPKVSLWQGTTVYLSPKTLRRFVRHTEKGLKGQKDILYKMTITLTGIELEYARHIEREINKQKGSYRHITGDDDEAEGFGYIGFAAEIAQRKALFLPPTRWWVQHYGADNGIDLVYKGINISIKSCLREWTKYLIVPARDLKSLNNVDWITYWRGWPIDKWEPVGKITPKDFLAHCFDFEGNDGTVDMAVTVDKLEEYKKKV